MPAFTSIGRSLLGASDPAIAQAAQAAAFAGTVRDALAPLGSDGKPAYAPAAAYPQSADALPKRLAGFAAMLAAGLPIRAASVRAPGTWDTHANQEETLPKNLQLTFDSLLAFQRDLEARGLGRPRAHARVVGVRRRAAENGSGTDHGAAGVGFLIGTRAAGRHDRRVPRRRQARRRRQPARHLGLPRPLRRALRRPGSASTPPPSCRTRGIGKPVILK